MQWQGSEALSEDGDTVVDGVDCATWWAQGKSVKKMCVLHSGPWESRDESKQV